MKNGNNDRQNRRGTPRDREDRCVSGFGYFIYELMAKRRLSKQKQLLAKLEEVGFETKPQNLSNWFHGTQPPTEFLIALVEALEMNEEEEKELYRKYVREARPSPTNST